MAEKLKPIGEGKAGKEASYENLLVAIVLIFTFIYFLFQLYAWFAGSSG